MDQLTVGHIRQAIKGLPDESVVIVTLTGDTMLDLSGEVETDFDVEPTQATPDHAKRTLTITV